LKLSIPSLYSEYGRYSDAYRAIPFYKDCLKPVERRLLYTLHQVAKKKFVKAVRITGDCNGKYHPHGDESTYKALVQIVTRGFAVGQGNWGYINLQKLKAAAMRYPEIKANVDLDNFFSDFLKFVRFHDPENLSELQPEFLPSPVPLGIIGSGLTTGISFNTVTMPRYSLPDLITRLEYLLRKEFNPNEPIKTIIPQMNNCDVYEEIAGDFEKILTIGVGILVIVPKIEIKPNCISILGKPPAGLKTLMSHAEQDDYSFIDLSDVNGFNVEVFPNKGKITQQFINIIYKLIKTRNNIICNVVKDDDTVTLMSIDNLILISYNNWVNTFELKLKDDKFKLENKIFALKVIEIVRKIIVDNDINIKRVDNILQIFKKQYQKTYQDITEDDISKTCSKNSIKQLIEHNLDIIPLQKDLQKVNDDLNNIAQVAFTKVLKYKGA